LQAKTRIEILLAIVGGDETALKLIQDVLARACNYVNLVFRMERALQMHRLKPDSEDPKGLTKDLEGLRRIGYDDLVYSIKVANRYLFNTFENTFSPGGIYSEDPIHLTDYSYRREIENWAGELVMSYFSGRKQA
jgi:hypothetical protein